MGAYGSLMRSVVTVVSLWGVTCACSVAHEHAPPNTNEHMTWHVDLT
jgi:hypothetical protein